MGFVPVSVVAAIGRRPRLWGTAIVEFRRLLPNRWWRRPPFLPRPDAALMRFRAVTQYGDADHPLESADVITWLIWCRAENRRSRGSIRGRRADR